jgi:hypothetical protein
MEENVQYEYFIDALGVQNELNGKENVVYEIRVTMQGTKKVVTEQYGESLLHKNTFFVVHVPTDNLENFVEFDKLTKEQIEEWVEKYAPQSVLENCKKNLRELLFPTKKYVKPNF